MQRVPKATGEGAGMIYDLMLIDKALIILLVLCGTMTGFGLGVVWATKARQATNATLTAPSGVARKNGRSMKGEGR